MYNVKNFTKIVNFSGTKLFCSEVEILQNVDAISNGELDFFNSIMSYNHIDLLVDVGASNTPYYSSLIERYSIKSLFIDNAQIPLSTPNSLSLLGYLGDNGIDINLLFNIYNSTKVFLKIDTDEHQIGILKQISDVNWGKIAVIQFEYDYTHKNKKMAEFVLSKMNTSLIYYISSRGLHKINENQIDDSLYKNLVIFNKEFFSLIKPIDTQDIFLFDTVFDKFFLKNLSRISQTELVNGNTKMRRSELNLPLDTFNKKIISFKYYIYKILYISGLKIMTVIKKIEKKLYQLAFNNR
jgi:hypothetical protein